MAFHRKLRQAQLHSINDRLLLPGQLQRLCWKLIFLGIVASRHTWQEILGHPQMRKILYSDIWCIMMLYYFDHDCVMVSPDFIYFHVLHGYICNMSSFDFIWFYKHYVTKSSFCIYTSTVYLILYIMWSYRILSIYIRSFYNDFLVNRC